MAVRIDASGDNLRRTTGLPSSSTTMSFCAWVYLVADRNDYQNFFFVEHSGFGSQDIFLSTDSDGTTLMLFDGGAALTGASLSTATWYFIAFTRSNTSRALYYAAATAAGLTAVTNSTTQTISDTHDALWWMNDVYGEWVSGRMAASKLWDGVQLTQAELELERWRILPARTENLYGWWPMFPGSGERVRDYSGNGRDLTEAGTITDEDPPPVSWGARSILVPYFAAAPPSVTGMMTPNRGIW